MAVAVAAGSVSLASHQSWPLAGDVIGGPYARLLAQSVDVGPARSERVQLTADLYHRAEPVALTTWARGHGLSVRWRAGDDWAFIEGTPAAVGDDGLGTGIAGVLGVPEGTVKSRVFHAKQLMVRCLSSKGAARGRKGDG